jgi:hypothetical protein
MMPEMPEEQAGPRLTGEAAWKAERDTIEQHNAAAKKRARERPAAANTQTERERRLAAQEELQLRALNARLSSRN